jgi:hypothetical protein
MHRGWLFGDYAGAATKAYHQAKPVSLFNSWGYHLNKRHSGQTGLTLFSLVELFYQLWGYPFLLNPYKSEEYN